MATFSLVNGTLPPKYDPAVYEQPIYAFWEKSGAFSPPTQPRGEPYTIVMPPPNVTGALHLGHALNGTIQDTVARFMRMRGKDVEWIPGTDHAGIATQAVVERKLFAEQGKTRLQLGRQDFEKEMWKWKDEYGNHILEQFRRMGLSADWPKERFTLDEQMSRAVREAFVRLWEKGLIYRGKRLVNWDCALQTAVSDDEVEMTPQRGKLYYIHYNLEGSPDSIPVATTRPETIVGDTALAVHPEDDRFRSLIGKQALVPLVGRPIPIISDETVNPNFGTGVVKVTPGHDQVDFDRGVRHGLPIICIMNPDGTMNQNAGSLRGLSREKARVQIVESLKQLGLLDKIEPHDNVIPISDRSKTAIEPLVSEQWFVSMKTLAAPAIEAVTSQRLIIEPKRWEKVYLAWLNNVRDWCISRQLWWGHRIPVWYDEDGTAVASRVDLQIGSPHPVTGKPIIRQDDDVMDTWASSWLWPFATLGWPESTDSLRRFYPTNLLSTAPEIIYLWVARMMMASYQLMTELPEDRRCAFSHCYIHATILDSQGRRMSKSAGNGIDPIVMIDKYGADAVRLALILLTSEGQDAKLDESRFEMSRRFVNKLWNAVRFCSGYLAGADATAPASDVIEDRWIMSRLAKTRRDVTAALEGHHFHEAALTLYRFVWDDLCDWYLEFVKARLREPGPTTTRARDTLWNVLNDLLTMLHPYLPFVTEVLWAAIHEAAGRVATAPLIASPWPSADRSALPEGEDEFDQARGVILAVRRLKRLLHRSDHEPVNVKISAPRPEIQQSLRESIEQIRLMTRASGIVVLGAMEEGDSRSLASTVVSCVVRVEVPADIDREQLLVDLHAQLQEKNRQLSRLNPSVLGRPSRNDGRAGDPVQDLRVAIGDIERSIAELTNTTIT